MNAGVSNQDSFTFWFVLAPSIIELNSCSQLFALEHGTMQRTDGLNVEGSSFLQDTLYLRTILATDIEIVATCLACPIVSLVGQCTKFAESIGREEHFIQGVVAHDNFRPVYHRSPDKLQLMTAQ